MDIIRVVTGIRADGTSEIASAEPVAPVRSEALAGFTFFPLWATEDGASLRDGQTRPYFPGPGGTRFVAVTWEPAGSVDQTSAADPAEAEALLPGLLAAFEPGSAFHATDSIDYGICVAGEMWLILDEGREVHLTPGSVVVQRGTRHAWENRSSAPATMVFAQVGADPARL